MRLNLVVSVTILLALLQNGETFFFPMQNKVAQLSILSKSSTIACFGTTKRGVMDESKSKPRGLRSRLTRRVQQTEAKPSLPSSEHTEPGAHAGNDFTVEGGPAAGRREAVSASAIVDEQPLLLSPEAKGDAEAAAMEQALHDLFMRQVGLRDDPSDVEETYAAVEDGLFNFDQSSIRIVPSRMRVENPTMLLPGSIVELLYQKRLAFGNVIGRRESDDGKSNSVLVRLSTGADVAVDVAQIISVWEVLSDEKPPTAPVGWAHVATEALGELQRMSPRKSDLSEFWWIVSQQRSKSLAVDSLDVGVYIFQESKFKKWVDQFDDGTQSRVYALSAAQRYAAALILNSDNFHFKRQSSRFIDAAGGNGELLQDELDHDEDEDEDEIVPYAIDGEHDWIIEGGYKVLDAGLVSFKECDTFEAYYRERKGEADKTVADGTKASAFRASCITRQLRMLELYALSQKSNHLKAGATPKAVKMLLKRLKLPVNPLGARQALLDMGHSSSSSQEERFQPRFRPQQAAGDASDTSAQLTANSSPQELAAAAQAEILKSQSERDLSALDGYAVNITPWPEDVLAAAENLKRDCDSYRQQLLRSKLSVPPVGKIGPTGRLDFRAAADTNPVLCIDQRKAEFFDDAFSLSPRTGELMIHVTDATNFLRKYEALENIAKVRVAYIK